MIYALIGESGGGKSTIENYLCDKFKMIKLISHTTRPIRKSENNGVDYYFISRGKFIELISEGKMWEHVEYNNNLYGLCSENVDYKNKDYVVVVELHGYKQLKNIIGNYLRGIYVYVDEKERLMRLLERGDCVDDAIKRIVNDRESFKNIKNEVDLTVENKNKISDTIEVIDVHFGLSFFTYAKKIKSLKIYVAGPYTAKTESDILQNVNNAIDIGIQLMKKGHLPYIPHLSHWVEKRMVDQNIKYTWEDWMSFDIKWLKECDAIFYISSSKGADIERDFAQKNNKKLFLNIQNVPKVME